MKNFVKATDREGSRFDFPTRELHNNKHRGTQGWFI